MKTKHLAIFTVFSVAACAAFQAAGADLATSTAYGGFRLNTVSPIVASTRAEAESLADWPVTYRAGETVTAAAPDGRTVTLVAAAATGGSVSFAPDADGLWRLANSSGAKASVCVAWTVFGSAWSLDFAADSPFKLHTRGEGPNRSVGIQDIPPVSYSGDDWLGDVSKASSLEFVAPSGAITTIPLAGTGVSSFRFAETGVWTVRLTMAADGTVREASINVSGGFVLIIR